MEKRESRLQVRAKKEHLCSFCFGPIEKGSEYILLSGIDGHNSGWYNAKRHIHCDALANRYLELTHDEKCTPSEVYDDLRDACRKTGCSIIHGCPLLTKGSFVTYKRMFACETAVSAYLPEGPIRNAALRSIRENKRGLDDEG